MWVEIGSDQNRGLAIVTLGDDHTFVADSADYIDVVVGITIVAVWAIDVTLDVANDCTEGCEVHFLKLMQP